MKDPNQIAVDAMAAAEPVLIDVLPLSEAVPSVPERTILTSGAPLAWSAYRGGQRRAIIGAAVYEGWARDPADAAAQLDAGDILVAACHDHSLVGSITGVSSPSMPVLVVEDQASGVRGHCTVYEGPQRRRLTYGVYDDDVARQLRFVRDRIAPALSAAIKGCGGVELRPLMRRALGMGDELHSRNTAATMLLTRELHPAIVDLLLTPDAEICRELLEFLDRSDLFFLHVGMAAAKCTADAAAGVSGSSIVTAMCVSEHEFSIRVSGCGDTWFRAPTPPLEAKLFDGFTPADLEFMGGESMIMETIGLGGMAAAAAFSLQDYAGGSADRMVTTSRQMYTISHAKHPTYAIPYLGFSGTPLGIDVHAIAQTGITPSIHMGAAHRDGGHIGAGLLTAPIEPFLAASHHLTETLGSHPATTAQTAATV